MTQQITNTMETYLEKFNREQISKANFIKDKANKEISSLENEIAILKEKIKAEKTIIAKANKDIQHYSE